MIGHGITAWALAGLVAGLVAKFLSGGWDFGGCLASIVVAVLGATAAGYLWATVARGDDDIVTVLVALLGATAMLWVMATLAPRR